MAKHPSKQRIKQRFDKEYHHVCRECQEPLFEQLLCPCAAGKIEHTYQPCQHHTHCQMPQTPDVGLPVRRAIEDLFYVGVQRL